MKMKTIILVIATVISLINCQSYRPVNTAVFINESAQLNCSAIDPNVIYETTQWTYLGSQTSQTNIIAYNYVIVPVWTNTFEFPDTNTHHIKIKKVDHFTTGLYECLGFAQGGNLTTFYYSYLLTFEKVITCAESTQLSFIFPNQTKIIYCYTKYAGDWPPSIEINVNGGSVKNSANVTNHNSRSKTFSETGSCILVDDMATYDANMKFNAPPDNILYDNSYDKAMPDLFTDNFTMATNDSNVPTWLKTECYQKLVIVNYDKIPKNVAVSPGNPTTLNCSIVNKQVHDYGSWALSQSQTNQIWLITSSFEIQPTLQSLYEFPVADIFNLRVKTVDEWTSGLYACSGVSEGDIVISYNAYVSTLGDAQCTSEAHSQLGSSQKIVYCFADYASEWAPEVSLRSNGNGINSANFSRPVNQQPPEYSQVGSCAIISDSASFDCNVHFNEPPNDVVILENTDTSAPEYQTTCMSPGSGANVPSWLVINCAQAFNLNYTTLIPPPTPTTTTPSLENLQMRPKNTAVFIDEEAILNCSSIDPSINYEITQWFFLGSQTSEGNIVAYQYSIVPIWQNRFEFPDNETHNLKIKQVDRFTTGAYECLGFANNGNLTNFYYAYLLSFEQVITCEETTALGPEFPAGTKIVYCYSKYAGDWPPTISISASPGTVKNEKQFTRHDSKSKEYSVTGACSVIDSGSDYTAEMQFMAPPSELTNGLNYDKRVPDLKTNLVTKSAYDTTVPVWLKDECRKNLIIVDYTNTPKNTAVIPGQAATMNCSLINSDVHAYGSWALQQSQTDAIWLVTASFDIQPHLKNLFEFPVENVFNLKVKAVDEYTTGLYGCSGFNNEGNISNSFNAFLSILDNPSCSSKSHYQLTDRKVVYCFAKYASAWSPTVQIKSGGKFLSSAYLVNKKVNLVPEYSEVGGCTIIDKVDNFDCSMHFNPPPPNVITVDNTDKSAPELETSCVNGGESGPAVPIWLVNQCADYFNLDSGDKFNYRPANTAVYFDEPAQLNCSAINPNIVYETTQWTFIGSQTSEINIISYNYVIVPIWTGSFEFPDVNTHHIKVKKVDRFTTGTYECLGFAEGGNLTTFYHAYLLSFERKITCAESTSLGIEFPSGSKIIYCYSKYSGDWPPTIDIKVAGGSIKNEVNVTSHNAKGRNYSETASCMLVDNAATYNASMTFNQPPQELILGASFDTRAPKLFTNSVDKSVNDLNVPAWIKNACSQKLMVLNYDIIPKNVAVPPGSSTTLNCSIVNSVDHEYGSWALRQSQTNQIWLITSSFDVQPHLQSLFDFPVPDIFNLRVKTVDMWTTGLYGCSGVQNNDIVHSYNAFVSTLDTAQCSSESHTQLGSNQKIVYCFANYASDWAPQVLVKSNGNSLQTGNFNQFVVGAQPQYSQVGSCAVIANEVSFDCNVHFNEPPSDILILENTDTTAPEYQTSCRNTQTGNSGTSVPSWLVIKCAQLFNLDFTTLLPPTTPIPTTLSPDQMKKIPKNTAVFIDQEATLNCSAIDTTINYEGTQWLFFGSQTSDSNIIAYNYTIVSIWTNTFEFPDNINYHLKIKKVDKFTTGTYECLGFAAGGSLTTFYHAYLLAFEQSITCEETTALGPEFPAGMKIVYCYSKYSGDWPPTIEINPTSGSVNNAKQFTRHDPKSNEYSLTGACSVILSGADFNCKMHFKSPPNDLIYGTSYDKRTPDLMTTTCTKSTSDKTVPSWLKGECMRNLVIIDYNTIPKNTAVLPGQAAVMNCSIVNSNVHSYGSWALHQSQTNEVWLITSSFDILPHLTELFEFPNPNAFNLKVKSVDKYTSGLYGCSGFNDFGNITNTYNAFLSVLAQPSCSRKTHYQLIGRKMVYCFANYSGAWSPTIQVKSGGKFLSSAYVLRKSVNVVAQYSEVAGCTIIDDNDNFDCNMHFNAPPSSAILLDNTDRSAPDLETTCMNSGISGPIVPDWIVRECNDYFNLDNGGKVQYRPSNTASFIDEPAQLNCSAIDQTIFYELTQWSYLGSQTSLGSLIAYNFDIIPQLVDVYSFVDEITYHLKIKKVNDVTTGTYECLGIANNGTLITNYRAYLLAFEKKFTCGETKSLSPSFPPNSKIVYCVTKYAGDWAPIIKINPRVGQIRNSRQYTMHDEKSETYSETGTCVLVNEDENYDSTLQFDKPPKEVIYDSSYDTRAPDLFTNSFNKGTDDSSIPQWFKERCINNLVIIDYNTTPKNIAILPGESTILNCSIVNSNDHFYGAWALEQSQSMEVLLITENFDVMPIYKNLFEFPTPNIFNLKIKIVDKYTSGLYGCVGYGENGSVLNQHGAFVSTLAKPICGTKPHMQLSSSQRLAFCFTDYASQWPPIVDLTVNNITVNAGDFNLERISSTNLEYSQFGSCSIINENAAFGCNVRFGAPPSNVITVDGTDTSAPKLAHTCANTNSPSVPDWLVKKCHEFYRLDDETTVMPLTSTTTTTTTRPTTRIATSTVKTTTTTTPPSGVGKIFVSNFLLILQIFLIAYF